MSVYIHIDSLKNIQLTLSTDSSSFITVADIQVDTTGSRLHRANKISNKVLIKKVVLFTRCVLVTAL